jgi:hypothetical protein
VCLHKIPDVCEKQVCITKGLVVMEITNYLISPCSRFHNIPVILGTKLKQQNEAS